jgi:hypothetical protein
MPLRLCEKDVKIFLRRHTWVYSSLHAGLLLVCPFLSKDLAAIQPPPSQVCFNSNISGKLPNGIPQWRMTEANSYFKGGTADVSNRNATKCSNIVHELSIKR